MNESLEKSLQSFRVLSAPAQQSWKLHYAQEEFSSPDLLKCDDFERNQFAKRLREGSCTIQPNIRLAAGSVVPPVTLEALVSMLTDESRKNKDKMDREVIYSTSNGERPAGDRAFLIWNGFQVIDMDIKDRSMAIRLKKHIFKTLYRCNWFLGVTLSSSGKGLHVYTKITVPEEYGTDLRKHKMLYLTNFRHKFSFVYIACLGAAEKMGFTTDDLQQWMDISMFRPAQGAFIGYDPHPLINTHYFEDYIYICFDNVEDLGHPEIDWVSHPDLKHIFARWEWFEDTSDDDTPEVKLVGDASTYGPTGQGDKVHYKHNERWRLANTLVAIFGLNQAIKYLRGIVSNKVPDKELVADCTTAARHEKPIDPWAVNRLNRSHGFNIKINISSDVSDNELLDIASKIRNPNNITQSTNTYELYMTKDQHLSDIQGSILGKLGRISLIEAGPGLGKTEMVKRLASAGKKVMLVLPFTSIIKSKVEHDKSWTYSYGGRKPDLTAPGALALTVDKFSRLNIMDIKTAGYDYIFIDESHLLFMSEYRPVMSRVIGMIINTEVPVVMMSGTPTGELVFFKDLVHIHIRKEETRRKDLEVNLVDTTSSLLYHMCKDMAADIASGRRILFPSNEGTAFSRRVRAGVQFFLELDHAIYDEVKLKYYKKSNLGEDFMDDVNFGKTIKDIQIVMCTTYMGCGVDIEDKYNFQIYFGDLCTAAECDQWCNRLRDNDLHVKLFVAKNDADGNSREIHKFRPISFRLSNEEMADIQSILNICNNMIERNPTEYKYNNIVASIVRDNRFIVYDEVQSKYYIDEIAYKTVIFERKYRDYAQQLPVFMRGMQAYGYDISAKDRSEIDITGTEIFGNLKDMLKLAADETLALNTTHIEELLDLITETRLSIYKEVLAGHLEIRKGDTWEEDMTSGVMTVKNVEVFEKVVPIFVSMSREYDIDAIKGIFAYCRRDSGTYNFAAIQRIRTLIRLKENSGLGRLDLPIEDFMTDSYNFVSTCEVDGECKCHKSDLEAFINNFTKKVLENIDNNPFSPSRTQDSPLTIKRVSRLLEKLFKCLVRTGRPNKSGIMSLEVQDILWTKRNETKSEAPIYVLPGFLEDLEPIKRIENETNN